MKLFVIRFNIQTGKTPSFCGEEWNIQQGYWRIYEARLVALFHNTRKYVSPRDIKERKGLKPRRLHEAFWAYVWKNSVPCVQKKRDRKQFKNMILLECTCLRKRWINHCMTPFSVLRCEVFSLNLWAPQIVPISW